LLKEIPDFYGASPSVNLEGAPSKDGNKKEESGAGGPENKAAEGTKPDVHSESIPQSGEHGHAHTDFEHAPPTPPERPELPEHTELPSIPEHPELPGTPEHPELPSAPERPDSPAQADY
jgi:hypothetical protein